MGWQPRGPGAVEATCVSGVALASLSPNARIWGERVGCFNTRHLYLTGLWHPEMYQVAVHGNCQCCELAALHNRHLIDRSDIPFDFAYFAKCASFAEQSINLQAVSPLTFKAFVDQYTGRKKKAYWKAAQDVKELGYDSTWARVSMFVKADKYCADEVMSKPPRAIQFRNPRFNLLVGVWLKPLEEQVYELQVNGMPAIAKTMTPDVKAETLKAMWEGLDDPIAILADHSKFDSCNRVEHLKRLHGIYLQFCNSSHLRWLLSQTLVNRGRTNTGLRYRVRGTRMSGDYDTALGNTLLNYLVLKSWLGKLHGYLLIDGDDSVIMLNRRDLPKLDFSHFGKMGFKTTTEIVEELHLVEFCRSKVLPGAVHMARNWRRALSNYAATIHYYPFRVMHRYVKGIALGDLIASRGVPILQRVAQELSQLPGQPIHDPDSEWKRRIMGDASPEYISPNDRIDYSDQWSVSVSEQLAFEALPRLALLKATESETRVAWSTLPHA